MTSLSPPFFSSRDNSKRRRLSILDTQSTRNYDSVRVISYPLVQYRRSGQYHRYSTDAETRIYVETEEEPGQVIENFQKETKRMKKSQDVIEIIDSNSDEENTDGIEDIIAMGSAVSNIADKQTMIATRNPKARDDDESSTKNNFYIGSKNRSLVQALRDLYHSGRTPSSDEISSFSTTLQSRDDEDAVNHETCNEQRIDGSENEFDYYENDEDNGYCYSGIETSLFYSEDLVVEWTDSSSSSSKEAAGAAISSCD
mmetsp:Transcript_4124/g.9816  ORF Transcript_4124/g.9816 Transcript_4124/m.9816 type:complete len:256 (+) Transcript_4124:206-973(+)